MEYFLDSVLGAQAIILELFAGLLCNVHLLTWIENYPFWTVEFSLGCTRQQIMFVTLCDVRMCSAFTALWSCIIIIEYKHDGQL